MPADYRTVRLMKNRLYPTYQLHAVMAARKTTPEDGLKIGVLTILRLAATPTRSRCSPRRSQRRSPSSMQTLHGKICAHYT